MSLPETPARIPGEHRSGLTMAASGIAMALVDLQQGWLEVNPAFEQLLGYRSSELVGRSIREFIHDDDAHRDIANNDRASDRNTDVAIAALISGKQAFVDLRQRYRHREGRLVNAQAHVVAVRDAQGHVQSLLLQLHDIGDTPGADNAGAGSLCDAAAKPLDNRRSGQSTITAVAPADSESANAREASLEQRAQALETANRQLQRFADAVSHDLRAPLRSIESFSALLAQHCTARLDDVGRDQLDRIRAATTRMSGLLDSLGDLSYATRTQIKPADVDLSLLADWVVAELQDAEPARKVAISVQPGLQTHGDERLLKLMLVQLIGNAWKFSHASAQPRIDVGGQVDASGLHLFVRDAGCGFDMRYAHKLFEPFQRLHGPDKGGGHGLGLAIAQRIAERHGGRIRGESDPGAGSTFHVDLPAAAAIDI